MRPTVLTFNLAPHKLNAVRVLGQKLQFRTIVVPPERAGHTVGELFRGVEGDCPAQTPFDEEVMVLDLPDVLMNFLLQGLRREKASVDLKAAHTETNDSWTADSLYHELCSEREAFAKGGFADHSNAK